MSNYELVLLFGSMTDGTSFIAEVWDCSIGVFASSTDSSLFLACTGTPEIFLYEIPICGISSDIFSILFFTLSLG